jgi:SAM-dependent methyltransferase
MERRAELIAQGARLAPGIKALEIGCGTGLFTEYFSRSGAHLIALDVSSELLTKALGRRLPEDRVHFHIGRFEDYRFENPALPTWRNGPFDAVIGSSVLHHLDLSVAMDRIRDLLKLGGWLSFAEPNLLNPQVFIERNFRRFFPYVSPDETAFIRWPLRTLLKRKGFDEITIIPFDWLHPATPPPWIPWVEQFGKIIERALVLREFSGSLLIRARRSR